MAPKKSAKGGANRPLLSALLLLLIAGSIAVWLLRPGPVELGEDGYQVAIALYNACNQKDTDKISALEPILNDPDSDQHSREWHFDPAGKRALNEIFDLAKSGDWVEASDRCREIMNDQIK